MTGFWKVCSFLSTQYLVGPPFAWITASMRRGMEAISLWHCSCVIEAQVALIVAFRSSPLLGLVSLIFLLTIPHRFSMGFRSGEFAGQSSTVTTWAMWAGAKLGRCQDSLLLVKLSQVFESALLDSILKLMVIPLACAHFPTQFLPSSQLCIWFTLIQHSVKSHTFQ